MIINSTRNYNSGPNFEMVKMPLSNTVSDYLSQPERVMGLGADVYKFIADQESNLYRQVDFSVVKDKLQAIVTNISPKRYVDTVHLKSDSSADIKDFFTTLKENTDASIHTNSEVFKD